jgi:hypothetical protein
MRIAEEHYLSATEAGLTEEAAVKLVEHATKDQDLNNEAVTRLRKKFSDTRRTETEQVNEAMKKLVTHANGDISSLPPEDRALLLSKVPSKVVYVENLLKEKTSMKDWYEFNELVSAAEGGDPEAVKKLRELDIYTTYYRKFDVGLFKKAVEAKADFLKGTRAKGLTASQIHTDVKTWLGATVFKRDPKKFSIKQKEYAGYLEDVYTDRLQGLREEYGGAVPFEVRNKLLKEVSESEFFTEKRSVLGVEYTSTTELKPHEVDPKTRTDILTQNPGMSPQQMVVEANRRGGKDHQVQADRLNAEMNKIKKLGPQERVMTTGERAGYLDYLRKHGFGSPYVTEEQIYALHSLMSKGAGTDVFPPKSNKGNQ